MKHFLFFKPVAIAFLLATGTAALSQAPIIVRRAIENDRRNGTLPSGNATQRSDGSILFPNGTVYYPDGRVDNTNNGPRNDGSVSYPDGRILRPDGTVSYPNDGYPTNDRYERNQRLLPPGQAKKMYGKKNAKDFAPGNNRRDHDDYDHNDDKKKYKKGNHK